jgi:hypothetical protein
MCLYCLAEANSLENVLPAAFGEFKDAPNLNNYICAPCNNGPLGLLDQQIARCGPEALLRKFYAVEGRAEHAKVNPFARGSAGGKRLESSAIDGTADRVLSASMETLARLREQGKIRHVGLSNVTLEHLERARKIVPIVSVQNRYSFADREWDYLLNHCEQNEIVFIPWAPLGQNRQAYAVLEKAAKGLGATPLQVAPAWLLRRSTVILPIPGTSSAAHVAENVAAAGLRLPDELFKELSELSFPPASLR